MGRPGKARQSGEHPIQPTDWQVLAFVEEPRYGRVWMVEQRTLADGSTEQRKRVVRG